MQVIKKTKMLIVFCIPLFMILNSVCAYEALQGPTELRYWDEGKAYNGYTLFAAGEQSYLIDMEGNIVNIWPIGRKPRLLENGNILDQSSSSPLGFRGFEELDWDGNFVWEYYETRENYHIHHDWMRIFNKKLNEYTTMYIANKDLTHEECIAAGCDPAGGPYEEAQMDAIVEVDMKGNVIWEWWFFDHVIQDIDPTKENYVGEGKTIADYPGKLNLNLPGKSVHRDWLHTNSLDYNEELDQIVFNAVNGEFYVVDHGNTFIPGDPEASMALAASDAGDFLYRFGDPARYEQGEPPSLSQDWTRTSTGNKQIGGSHDVQWIDPGLPGEGHFLIFNNGHYLFERTPQSYIFEINGFIDAEGVDTGNYVNPPDAGYYKLQPILQRSTHKFSKLISKQIVWIYNSKSNQGFFSHVGAGVQRLPNGNTLICASTEGHIFEVTPEGELAWEYISPVIEEKLGDIDKPVAVNYKIVEVIPDSYPTTNMVRSAYRYGPDHPALAGKDLTPRGTLTGKPPSLTGDTDFITGTITEKTPVLGSDMIIAFGLGFLIAVIITIALIKVRYLK